MSDHSTGNGKPETSAQPEQTASDGRNPTETTESGPTTEFEEITDEFGVEVVDKAVPKNSITSSGNLNFNMDLSEKHLHSYDNFVVMLNDAEETMIIKPFAGEVPDEYGDKGHVFNINVKDNGSVQSVHFKQILQKHSSLPTLENESHRYIAEWNDELNCVVVDLSQEPEVTETSR